MFINISKIFLIFIVIYLNNNPIYSAPTIGSNNAVESNSQNRDRNSNSFLPGDYVPDSDLEEVISHLPNTYEPANFVSDDIPLEELLALIEQSNDQNVTTTTTTTTTLRSIGQHLGDRATGATQDNANVLPNLESTIISGHVINDNNVVSNQNRPTQAPSSQIATTMRTIVNDIEECPICLEQLELKVQQQLICGHEFHRACLHDWFNQVSNIVIKIFYF